jgi:class 3 adenylate cyclase/tetratricopeptide (TPR) repeat protein
MAESKDSIPTSPSAGRRHLTLLFADLSDSTAMAGTLQPEDQREVREHFERCAHDIVSKHGGKVVGFHGDGVLAMFGFPESSEHDGRRATEAALDLHEAIGKNSRCDPAVAFPTLRMHSGIHSGLVLVTNTAAGSYKLDGEAPSIAVRLSEAAGRNEILVSATTLGTESHFFEIRERGDLALQGKVAAVTVYEVLGRSSANTRFEARSQHGLAPFVGRDAELALFDRTLRESMSGCVRAIAVVGDVGVGKTRLVQECLRRSASIGCLVCRGHCDDYGGAEPLQPFLQILRSLCELDSGGGTELSASELERWNVVVTVRAELLRAASCASIGRSSTGERPAGIGDAPSAIRDLMSALAVRRPLVLFIDDWQWADDASRQLLAAVRDLADRPILVVTTSRVTPHEDTALSESDVRVVLAPLAAEDTVKAIRALRPEADPFVVKRFQQLSGGNPLFIEELCHSSDREAVEWEPERAAAGPAWLSTLIESRVARLPAVEADLVRKAAVIGTVVPSWLLEKLTGRGEKDPVVRDLADRDLVFPEAAGTLRFKHGVTRQVVYQSVGLRERERIHLEIAEFLRGPSTDDVPDELLEALAYHYRAAAKRDLAVVYAERAGKKALTAAALDRARTHYRAALEMLELCDETYPDWIRIAQKLGLACVFDPARDQLPIFRRAVEIAAARADEDALARAEYWLGYISYGLGEMIAAIHHCERAGAHCARALDALRGMADGTATVKLEAHATQVLATLAQARAAAGQHEGVIEQLDEAIAIKRRHRTEGRPAVGLGYTLASKGWVLGDRGCFGAAHECFFEALDAAHGNDQPVRASILGWQGAVYLWQGRWPEAVAAATDAQRIAERVGSLYIFAMSQALGEYARWMLDGTAGAIDTIVRATSWLEAHDKRLFISLAHGWLAEAMLATGRYPQARAYAARALQRARHRDVFGAALAYRALARLPAAHRRHTPEHYLDAAMRSAQARRSPREEAVTLLHQGEVAGAAGRRDEAAGLLSRAWVAFSAMEMHWHQQQAERLLALP